jgi:hypothetical protein
VRVERDALSLGAGDRYGGCFSLFETFSFCRLRDFFAVPLADVAAQGATQTLNPFSSQMLQLKAQADGKGGSAGAGAAAGAVAKPQDSSYEDLVTTEKLRLLADAQKRTIEALKSELVSQVRV